MNVNRINKNELPDIELPDGEIEVGVAVSYSMKPFFPKGTLLLIQKNIPETLNKGDLVFINTQFGLMMHRIVKKLDETPERWITKGDWNTFSDPPCKVDDLYGIATAYIRKGKIISLQTPFFRIIGKAIAALYPVTDLLLKVVRKTKARLTGKKYDEHPKAGA